MKAPVAPERLWELNLGPPVRSHEPIPSLAMFPQETGHLASGNQANALGRMLESEAGDRAEPSPWPQREKGQTEQVRGRKDQQDFVQGDRVGAIPGLVVGAPV